MSTCTQCVATGAVQCQGEQSTLLAYPALTKKNEEDVLICRYCGHAVLAHFNIGSASHLWNLITAKATAILSKAHKD